MKVNVGRFLQVPLNNEAHNKKDKFQMDSTLSIQQQSTRGTIRASSNFNGEVAASKLHGAFHGDSGLYTNTTIIIDVLTSHSNKQRQAIKRHYRILYRKDLESEIEEHLAGYFRDVALALMKEPHEFLADHLHAEIMEVVPCDKTLTELLCGRNAATLKRVKEIYSKKYSRDIEAASKKEMAGSHVKVLKILLSLEREDTDYSKAHKEAESLSFAGVGAKYESDEPILLTLLYTKSYEHLTALFDEYHNLSGRSIEDGIKRDFKGQIREALLTLVAAVKDPQVFVANELYDSLQESKPNDTKLIRILVAHSEHDLLDIKDKFLREHGVKLSNVILDTTNAGDYQKILYRLMGN